MKDRGDEGCWVNVSITDFQADMPTYHGKHVNLLKINNDTCLHNLHVLSRLAKGILFVRSTETDSGKPVSSSYSHLVSPFLILLQHKLSQNQFSLTLGRENWKYASEYPSFSCLFFTWNFCPFPLGAPSSLSALTVSYPTSNHSPPSALLRQLFSISQIPKHPNLILLHPPMSLLPYPSFV